MQMNAHIQTAIELLDIFFETHAPFDIIMAKFFKNHKWIGGHDRREIAEFVYAVFRNFEKLKFLTERITQNFGRFFVLAFLKTEKKLSLEEIQKIFSGKMYCPPKLSTFEEKFLASCELPHDVPNYVTCNYPAWMTPYLERAFGAENVVAEMMAMNEKAAVDLRVNTLKATKEDVRKLLSAEFKVADTELSETCLRVLDGRIGRNHPVLQNGLAEIQDEGSQLIAEICGAKAGDTVVDFCAGAGGKTLAIAAKMQNKGRIFALDKYVERLENAKIRFRRADVNNVFCQEITGKWLKRHVECADVVLVDAPCSGTGTWRRNPDMRAKFQPQDLEELLAAQEGILTTAASLVKKDGKLIYATCSILREEDENQVEKFLSKFPDFHAEPICLKNYSGQYLRLTPHQHKTDGFFAAVMKRE